MVKQGLRPAKAEIERVANDKRPDVSRPRGPGLWPQFPGPQMRDFLMAGTAIVVGFRFQFDRVANQAARREPCSQH